jgi:hypothetical protein
VSNETERRRDPRVPVALHGRWTDPDGAHPCRITNLSRGGCFVECDVLASPGARVRLLVHLSVVASLVTEAEVMHARATGFGVRFLNLDTDQQEILARAWTALARGRA